MGYEVTSPCCVAQRSTHAPPGCQTLGPYRYPGFGCTMAAHEDTAVFSMLRSSGARVVLLPRVRIHVSGLASTEQTRPGANTLACKNFRNRGGHGVVVRLAFPGNCGARVFHDVRVDRHRCWDSSRRPIPGSWHGLLRLRALNVVVCGGVKVFMYCLFAVLTGAGCLRFVHQVPLRRASHCTRSVLIIPAAVRGSLLTGTVLFLFNRHLDWPKKTQMAT